MCLKHTIKVQVHKEIIIDHKGTSANISDQILSS